MKNKEQALEWVRNFLNEVDTQDNRCTAKPIMFLLQTKSERIEHDDYYSHNARQVFHHNLMGGYSCESKESAIEWLKEYGLEDDRLAKETENIESFMMGEYWDTQEVCFTKKGIEQHLALNKHNYRHGFRDYVIHAFRNPEIHELFQALRILSTESQDAK